MIVAGVAGIIARIITRIIARLTTRPAIILCPAHFRVVFALNLVREQLWEAFAYSGSLRQQLNVSRGKNTELDWNDDFLLTCKAKT